MKKVKIALKAAIGLALFGFLFTACNTNGVGEDPTVQKGTEVTVNSSVSTKEDVKEVVTDVLKEYSDFFGTIQSSARAAKTGNDVVNEITKFSENLLKFIDENKTDLVTIYSGFGSSKDLSYSDSIDFEDLSPLEIVEACYNYYKDLTGSNISFSEFIDEIDLEDAIKELEVTDKYVALTKLKIALEASYKNDTNKVSGGVDTVVGVKIQNIDELIADVLKAEGRNLPEGTKVPDSIKYISVANKAKVSGSAELPSAIKSSYTFTPEIKVNENLEIRINMVNKEGKGGYFVISPVFETTDAIKLTPGNFSINTSEIFNAKAYVVKVSDGNKETFNNEYSKEEVDAFFTANKDLLQNIQAVVMSAVSKELRNYSDLYELVKNAALKSFQKGYSKGIGDDIDHLF